MTVGKYVGSVYDGAVSAVDKWGRPLTPSEEVYAIRQDSKPWADELPDIDASCFESLEEFEEWKANGCQRFFPL
jgi:hypothetical protein